MNRRGFLSSILAAGVAPAFVGSSVLMPVKRLIVPEEFTASTNSFEVQYEAIYVREGNLVRVILPTIIMQNLNLPRIGSDVAKLL